MRLIIQIKLYYDVVIIKKCRLDKRFISTPQRRATLVNTSILLHAYCVSPLPYNLTRSVNTLRYRCVNE